VNKVERNNKIFQFSQIQDNELLPFCIWLNCYI